MTCNKKTFEIKRISKKYPTTKEIKEYVSKFSKTEYSRLTANSRFNEKLLENIEEADKIAMDILGKKS